MTWTRREFIKTSSGALVSLSLVGCVREADAATVVFGNGAVLPVDAQFSEYSALAIRGNRVLRPQPSSTIMPFGFLLRKVVQ